MGLTTGGGPHKCWRDWTRPSKLPPPRGSALASDIGPPLECEFMNETRPSPGEIVYLACPYTDPDPEIRKHRFNCVTMVAAHLIGQGLIVYSPLTITHPIDLVLAREGETLGSDYWVRFDEAFMA